ncbi:hypothetical protein V8C86DRAFT_3099148 [Haematococcus lacustris]
MKRRKWLRADMEVIIKLCCVLLGPTHNFPISWYLFQEVMNHEDNLEAEKTLHVCNGLHCQKTRSKLKEKVPGSNIFDDITSFLFDLGMDFLTVNGQSVGVLGLRARDVPRHVQGRDACIAMLAIFLKSEPAKYVHGFMDQPLRDIKAAIYNKISITINKIEHVFVAIFTTFMADLPARWEIEWTDPVTFITAIYTGHPHQDHMQLTDEQYDARGLLAQQEVEAALAAARAANKPLKDSSIVYSAACRGARGVCVITQHLDYASSLDAFVTPTYHTFCLGVLRDFIEYLLSTASSLSTQAKTTIRERQAALHIPTDYGRKPTCCIDDRFATRLLQAGALQGYDLCLVQAVV